MAEFSRRRLLGSALGVGGMVAAASLLPPRLQAAMADTARRPGSLDEIEHVVIMMQENRSFDHYFGTLPGVRGFGDPNVAKQANGRTLFYQNDPDNPDGYLLPFHLDTRSTSAQAIPSTSHAWAVQHAAWNGGKMDNWLPAHRAADGDAKGPYTMSYYERADIPFQFALAEAFTICDNYHCSMLGPTWPNRIMHWTGTVDPNGTAGGPVISNTIPSPFRWTTYPERLTKAGVSWHVYQEEDDYGCNPLEFFQAYQDAKPGDALYEHGLTVGPTDQFARDVAADRLPTVSWIIPTAPQCEHPAFIPASGADFVAQHLDALAANPEVWRKTVFILNYDENDGLFDHVIPPTPPAGTPDEFVGGLPIGGGIRVPCIIVSPWTQGGFVASEPFDHTSVLRFLETITGVKETNISAWRRSTFGDLTSALGVPVSRPFPALPPTKGQFWAAEQEVATLPPVTLPGADQTPPVQPDPAASVASVSRIVENATTHAADFPDGTAGTNFPGIMNSVPDTAPTSGEHVYAVGLCSFSVSVVDPSTYKLVASVSAGAAPYGITKTPAGMLYLTNSGDNTVSVLDTSKGTITTTIKVGVQPHGIATAPDGTHVYVANTGPDTGAGGSHAISVLDTATNTVAATWQAGLAPRFVAAGADGRSLYASCYDGVSILDTGSGTVRRRLPQLSQGQGLTLHPDGTTCYLASPWSGTVSVVDTRSLRVRATVRTGTTPWQIAVSPDGSRVYVTCAGDDTVTVIDAATNRVVGSVGVHHIPTGITATADAIWVSTNTASTIDAIDPKSLSVLASVELGLTTEPGGIVVA